MSFILNNIIKPYVYNNIFLLLFYTIIVVITYSILSFGLSKTFTYFINSKYDKNEIFLKNIYKTLKNGNKMCWIYVIAFLSFMYSIFMSIKLQIQYNILVNITKYSRNIVTERLFKKLTDKYQEVDESDMGWLVTSSYWATKSFLFYIFENIIPFFVTFLIISIYLLTLNSNLFILTIIHFVIITCYIRYSNNCVSLVEKQDINHRKHMNLLGDKVKNMLNIIFNNTLNKELDDLYNNFDIYCESERKLFSNNSRIISTTILLNYLYLTLIFIFIYMTNSINNVNISIIVMMLILYISIMNKFIRETISISLYIYKLKVLDNILTFDTEDKCTIFNNFKRIELKNVYFKYKDKFILNNINIVFEENKINVLLGKSGSGKTTIMKLILKMYDITSGDIYLDNKSINDICSKSIRNNIYYVNQRTILFNDTIMYNMKYGNKSKDNDIINLLNKYKLYDYFDKTDKGLYYKAGVNGSNLSLGMQKIIMIIRGILRQKNNILILDEPLTSLDSETRYKVINLIVNEKKNKTLIIITHDKEIITYADNTITI